jgi:hypothetical protein
LASVAATDLPSFSIEAVVRAQRLQRNIFVVTERPFLEAVSHVTHMRRGKTVFRDVIGSRGEHKLVLCLTNYEPYRRPLFRAGFLGDKWPVIDFYVELLGSKKNKPFFLAQAKSTARHLNRNARHIRISSKKTDIRGLIKMPGPTYMFAIHEPTGRVFVQSVHSGTPVRAITMIDVANELTPLRLRDLHNEVKVFWNSNKFKPTTSLFL